MSGRTDANVKAAALLVLPETNVSGCKGIEAAAIRAMQIFLTDRRASVALVLHAPLAMIALAVCVCAVARNAPALDRSAILLLRANVVDILRRERSIRPTTVSTAAVLLDSLTLATLACANAFWGKEGET